MLALTYLNYCEAFKVSKFGEGFKISKKTGFLIYLFQSASIGALTAFGLSFTNLSPLVMGGIIGTVLPALVMGCYVGHLASELFRKGEIEDDDYKGLLLFFSCITAASAAIGVVLVAAASAYGITTGTVSSGVAIGVLSPVIGLFVALAILKTAFKVNEYMVSPVIEKVKGCFSSQERNDNSNSCYP